MSDFITIRRLLLAGLPHLPQGTTSVFLAVLDRGHQQKDGKLGMTLRELATVANVGIQTARDCLKVLEETEPPVITLTEKPTYSILELNEHWVGEKMSFPFKFVDKEEQPLVKIEKLEAEVRRLTQHAATTRSKGSGLPEILQGEPRDLVIEIEKRRGYGLDAREAWLLGAVVFKYGPERVKTTWRQLQNANDPIRATFAALKKGAKGKGADVVESEPFKKVVYRTIGKKDAD